MHPTPTMWLGVQAASGTPALDAIALWARLPGSHSHAPWVIPSGPCTHAFVAWQHTDGWRYRLDAQMPRAKISQHTGGIPAHERWWRVLDGDISAAVRRAIFLDGTLYDLGEILAQGLTPVLPGMGRAPVFPHGLICTSMTLDVMKMLGGRAAALAASLPDTHPEVVGRALVNAAAVTRPGGWLQAENSG